MQFIKYGPDIPERLLRSHEDGRVVFFCGAGISVPAGLPSFYGLVKGVYERLGIEQTPTEATAIRLGQLDTAIGLLEGRVVGARHTVRRMVADLLKPDLSRTGVFDTHEALLTLSRSTQAQCRLVTTNFDRLFEELSRQRQLSIRSYQAPLLPVPKARWDGMVYLHGLIPEAITDSALNSLVLSSGDFGLAYLAERWASRFIGELFRNYVICFIGYSINDPVMRYMMDALAADRMLGESIHEVFAFGSYKSGRLQQVESEWRAKNVTPILYKEDRTHSFLHKTIRAWSDTYRVGAIGKERIVADFAPLRPIASTKEDDFVGRVMWALSDSSGHAARRFAEWRPVPCFEWLEFFSDRRYGTLDLPQFQVRPDSSTDEQLSFSLLDRPAPHRLTTWMRVSTNAIRDYVALDSVMQHMSNWLAQHIDEPKLLLWVADQGGNLHSYFRWSVEEKLRKEPPNDAMVRLWRLLLTDKIYEGRSQIGLYEWEERFLRLGLTHALKLELSHLLEPLIRFRGTAGTRLLPVEDIAPRELKAKDLIDWQLVLRTDYPHSALESISKRPEWQEALPHFLPDATNLLKDALDLSCELGAANARSDGTSWSQPSIKEHPQNRGYRDWTALIELTRDAWIATAERKPDTAWLEAQRWRSIRYPLFTRLAFFAASERTEIIPPHVSLQWLTSEDNWWLWSHETQREAFRLLVAIGPLLDPEGLQTLENAILAGPPREIFREDIDTEALEGGSNHDKWLRLAKINSAGVTLGQAATDEFARLSKAYPDWRVAPDERDEFAVWMGGDEDWREQLATPNNTKDIIAWLVAHPTSEFRRQDNWQERCRTDFRRTAAALCHLASRGVWPIERWRQGLQVWGEEKHAERSWRMFAIVISGAPPEVLKELAHTLGFWLQSMAKMAEPLDDNFIRLSVAIVELYADELVEIDEDPVFRAINHPVGLVTEAILRNWFQLDLEDNQGVPEVLVQALTRVSDPNILAFWVGRTIFTSYLVTLFRVDTAWTTEHLIPLFAWEQRTLEARAAWEGFLRSPRLFRPLLLALAPYMLQTAERYDQLGDHSEQFARLLTYIALEFGDVMAFKNLVAAVRTLPTKGRETIAQTLLDALESSGQRRDEYWRHQIQPFLHRVWPNTLDSLTPSIAEDFALLVVLAGDAFVDAFHDRIAWLRPSDHPDTVVRKLAKSDQCSRHPGTALDLLSRVVCDAPAWVPRELKTCLDEIRGSDPALADSPAFQRLSLMIR